MPSRIRVLLDRKGAHSARQCRRLNTERKPLHSSMAGAPCPPSCRPEARQFPLFVTQDRFAHRKSQAWFLPVPGPSPRRCCYNERDRKSTYRSASTGITSTRCNANPLTQVTIGDRRPAWFGEHRDSQCAQDAGTPSHPTPHSRLATIDCADPRLRVGHLFQSDEF